MWLSSQFQELCGRLLELVTSKEDVLHLGLLLQPYLNVSMFEISPWVQMRFPCEEQYKIEETWIVKQAI